jgi:hypothetical protein
MAAAPHVITLVFDGPPAPCGPHLVEIEDDQGRSARLPSGGPLLVEIEDDTGRSIAVGEWIDRGDTLCALSLSVPILLDLSPAYRARTPIPEQSLPDSLRTQNRCGVPMVWVTR